jgi:hypothetical protein
MSKFKESPITPGNRGKLGGIVFSKNHYGPFNAMKASPPEYRTDLQRNTTGKFTSLLQDYSYRLSDEQYKSWRNFSMGFKRTDTSGNIYSLTPRDVFVSCNSNFREVGLPVTFDTPPKVPPQSITSFRFETYIENGQFGLNMYFNPAINKNTRIYIFATHYLRLSVFKYKDSWFRGIGYVDGSFKSGDSLASLYKSRFPANASPRYKIALRVKVISAISGIASPIVEESAYFTIKSQE